MAHCGRRGSACSFRVLAWWSHACCVVLVVLRLCCAQPFVVRLVARCQDVPLPIHRRPLLAVPAAVSPHGDVAQTAAGCVLHAAVAAAAHGLPSQTTGGQVSQTAANGNATMCPGLHSVQLTHPSSLPGCCPFLSLFLSSSAADASNTSACFTGSSGVSMQCNAQR